jgi:hypothetical protein
MLPKRDARRKCYYALCWASAGPGGTINVPSWTTISGGFTVTGLKTITTIFTGGGTSACNDRYFLGIRHGSRAVLRLGIGLDRALLRIGPGDACEVHLRRGADCGIECLTRGHRRKFPPNPYSSWYFNEMVQPVGCEAYQYNSH